MNLLYILLHDWVVILCRNCSESGKKNKNPDNNLVSQGRLNK